jgi:hypothetical protein
MDENLAACTMSLTLFPNSIVFQILQVVIYA